MTDGEIKRPAVAIVGGGYSGVAMAIHLSRQSRRSLDITIVEPRPELGRGVAYSSTDPDHRLNAPTQIHCLYPDAMEHFGDWWLAQGLEATDPDARSETGLYSRRWDFGTYLNEQIGSHIDSNPSNSRIMHIVGTAETLNRSDNGWLVMLDDETRLEADAVILTTSNAPPAIPAPLRPLIGTSNLLENPWDIERFNSIPMDARVLIVGTGLTMADVTASLLREGPKRKIVAVSRRGLLPTRKRTVPADNSLYEELNRAVPRFVERHGNCSTVMDIFRALRADIRAEESDGGEWQVAFDELRDAAQTIWPSLSRKEQAMFMRHLRPWYETHRFRMPPQIEAVIDAARDRGHLSIMAGDIVSSAIVGNEVSVEFRRRGARTADVLAADCVINCTGPVSLTSAGGNPFLGALVDEGCCVANPFGLGIEVDEKCHVLEEGGGVVENLFAIGPLTRGKFGESNGVPFVMMQAVMVAEEFSRT